MLHDARAHLDGYDTGIHYADHFVGKLIQDLKDLGIFEETAIIVSADHGETKWAKLAEQRLEALSRSTLPGR